MVEVTEGNYRAYFTADCIYLQNIHFNKILTFEKFTCNIKENTPDILKNINVYAVMRPHCILGIMKILSYNFFVFVKSAILIGQIEICDIFKIKEAELIPITDDTTAANLSQEIKSHVLGIMNLLNLGFYYSFTYDLTNTKSKQKILFNENPEALNDMMKNMKLNNLNVNKIIDNNIVLDEMNSKQNLKNIMNSNTFNNNLTEKSENTNNSTDNDNMKTENNVNQSNDVSSNINNLNNNKSNVPRNFFFSSNKKFFWNFNLYSKFIKNDVPIVDPRWMIPCINGYVGLAENIDISDPNQANNVTSENKTDFMNKKIMKNKNLLNLYLISRRSIYHAGTRYLTRGIDDDGHVANFVETEQIVRYGNHLMSFIQIRGSAPIFFQQTGVTAQTEITRIPELTSPAFLKHIEEIQIEYYKMIFMINLMNFHKPNEQIITQNFENQIKMNNLRKVKYVFWDFQNECKSDNYERIDVLMKNMENVMNIFKFYCEDLNTGEIIKEQAGVIRTNCLDCLDRTNVIQSRFAWKMLEFKVF